MRACRMSRCLRSKSLLPAQGAAAEYGGAASAAAAARSSAPSRAAARCAAQAEACATPRALRSAAGQYRHRMASKMPSQALWAAAASVARSTRCERTDAGKQERRVRFSQQAARCAARQRCAARRNAGRCQRRQRATVPGGRQGAAPRLKAWLLRRECCSECVQPAPLRWPGAPPRRRRVPTCPRGGGALSPDPARGTPPAAQAMRRRALFLATSSRASD
jgi:hypothetical protein